MPPCPEEIHFTPERPYSLGFLRHHVVLEEKIDITQILICHRPVLLSAEIIVFTVYAGIVFLGKDVVAVLLPGAYSATVLLKHRQGDIESVDISAHLVFGGEIGLADRLCDRAFVEEIRAAGKDKCRRR